MYCINTKIHELLSRARASSLFRDSSWALIGTAIGRGLSLLSGMAVARFLGSTAFGEFGLIKSTLLTIATFSAFGLGYTATKFIAENKKRSLQHVYATHIAATTMTFAFSGFIAILTAIFADNIAVILKSSGLGPELRLMAIGIILNALITTQNGELAGFRAYKKIARNNTYYGVFVFITSVPLSYFYGIVGALIALILSLSFNCAMNYFTLKPFLAVRIRRGLNVSHVKELVHFSFPIALQEILYSISVWVGSIIIIYLSDYNQLGLYAAASQWYAVILFVPGALRNVALSHIAENTDNNEIANHIVARLMKFNFLSTIIPFVIVTSLSGFIARCYGDSFSELPPVLSAMTLYAVVSSLIGVQKQDLLAHGYNWFLFITNVGYYIICLGATYLLVKEIGHAALMYAVAGLLASILYLIVIHVKRRAIYKH